MNGQIQKPTYTFSDGTSVELKPIPPLLINMVNSSTKGKPRPPKIEVEYANGRKVLEDNPNDPTYLEQLDQWNQDKQLRLLKLIYVQGVAGSFYDLAGVDDMMIVEHLTVENFDNPTDEDYKYVYIAGKLLSSDHIEAFQNAVLQLTVPTQDAIEDSFRTPISTHQ